MPRFLPILGRLLRGLRNLWSVLGIAVVLFLLLEAAVDVVVARWADARAARRLRTAASSSKPGGTQASTDWTRDYATELRESFAFTPEPYCYWKSAPFAGRHINVDSAGRRRTVSAPAATAVGKGRPVRVFLFGGSTLWGVGARDEHTIASALSNELAARATVEVEVVNYGQIAYVNTQELLSLLIEVRRGNVPDIAVLYDGVNDCFSAYENRAAGNPIRQFAWDPIQYRKQDEVTHRLITPNLRNAAVVALADRCLRSAGGTHAIAEREAQRLAAEVLEVYRGNLRLLQTIELSARCRTLCYWQPSVFTKRPLAAAEQQVVNQYGESLKRFFDRVYRRVRADQKLAEAGIFHDISRVFEGHKEQLFFDYCHLTEGGNELVARRIATDVLRLIDEQAAQDGSAH